jgi:tRNA (guanosine-2'-O-)-methyltransferase
MDRASLESDLIKYLSGFVTPERNETFEHVLNNRTKYLAVVLEDIYQPHNASAVLRSCDCFGIQDVHIIENRNTYSINPDVALGSNKWLTLKKYNRKDFNTKELYDTLKTEGYRIIATVPHPGNTTIDEFDLNKGKSALVFGTEMDGLSDFAINEADEYIRIPMFGFTESFNISVSAAIILYKLSSQLRNSTIKWQLSSAEKETLKLEWLKRTIKKSELLIHEYMEKNKKNNSP